MMRVEPSQRLTHIRGVALTDVGQRNATADTAEQVLAYVGFQDGNLPVHHPLGHPQLRRGACIAQQMRRAFEGALRVQRECEKAILTCYFNS